MKKLKIIWILFALISILIWMPRLDGLLTKEYSAISDCVVLDDGWDITINEDTWQNVRLTELQFAAVSKGDKIIMQRTLPANWGLLKVRCVFISDIARSACMLMMHSYMNME